MVHYGTDLPCASSEWFAKREMEVTHPRSRPGSCCIHSLAHLLIRRFELEAGYAGSSLRERIYCDDDMAGLLIYTATPDSEGTLGGLVELARREDLGPMLKRALEESTAVRKRPVVRVPQACPTTTPTSTARPATPVCSCPKRAARQGNHYLDRSADGADAPSRRGDTVAFVARLIPLIALVGPVRPKALLAIAEGLESGDVSTRL